MTHKIIGISPSSNFVISDYVKNQLDAIKNLYPEVVVEQQNENSSLLLRYADKPDRFPCYIVLKNDTFKNILQSKLSDDQFISWMIKNLGI